MVLGGCVLESEFLCLSHLSQLGQVLPSQGSSFPISKTEVLLITAAATPGCPEGSMKSPM